MPKLVLINPVDRRNIFSFLNPGRSKSNGVLFAPPIGLGCLAAVTPREWQVELIDESVSPFA
jgi:hypothetical protein